MFRLITALIISSVVFTGCTTQPTNSTTPSTNEESKYKMDYSRVHIGMERYENSEAVCYANAVGVSCIPKLNSGLR